MHLQLPLSWKESYSRFRLRAMFVQLVTASDVDRELALADPKRIRGDDVLLIFPTWTRFCETLGRPLTRLPSQSLVLAANVQQRP